MRGKCAAPHILLLTEPIQGSNLMLIGIIIQTGKSSSKQRPVLSFPNSTRSLITTTRGQWRSSSSSRSSSSTSSATTATTPCAKARCRRATMARSSPRTTTGIASSGCSRSRFSSSLSSFLSGASSHLGSPEGLRAADTASATSERYTGPSSSATGGTAPSPTPKNGSVRTRHFLTSPATANLLWRCVQTSSTAA